MRATLNRQMFTARLFDSGALGVLGAVIHQFGVPGRYEAVIRQHDAVIGSVVFEASDASSTMQLDIDLASAGRTAAARTAATAGNCECGDVATAAAAAAPPVVSCKGYVIFYVSRGDGGYSVTVNLRGADQIAFDSTSLEAGDLFAVTLLAPTRYAMSNRTGGATGTIAVSASAATARSLAALSAVYVETQRDAFSPGAVEVISGQGIVFRCLETSRVVIEQLDEPVEAARAVGRRRFHARPHVASTRSGEKRS